MQRDIAVAVVTAFITLLGSYWQFAGGQTASEVAQLEAVFSRINSLEERTEAQAKEITELSVENATLGSENARLQIRVSLLQSQIDYGEGSELEAIFSFLESLDVPAWCKAYTEDDQFEMAYLNAAYEHDYPVTRELYVGQTDYDVFPVDIARAFEVNDRRVLESKGWIDFTEVVKAARGRALRRFWKFYHKPSVGPDLICGIQVSKEVDGHDGKKD